MFDYYKYRALRACRSIHRTRIKWSFDHNWPLLRTGLSLLTTCYAFISSREHCWEARVSYSVWRCRVTWKVRVSGRTLHNIFDLLLNEELRLWEIMLKCFFLYNGRKSWIGVDMKGRSRCITYSSIPEFSWTDWGKARRNSVQESPCHSWDSNREQPEYKSQALPPCVTLLNIQFYIIHIFVHLKCL
jgi:hypothetical protein